MFTRHPRTSSSRRRVFAFFFLLLLRPPTSTLFPYTTLFRSLAVLWGTGVVVARRIARPIQLLHDGVREIGSGRLDRRLDRKSTRLNSSHMSISYAVFCLKKKMVVVSWPSAMVTTVLATICSS